MDQAVRQQCPADGFHIPLCQLLLKTPMCENILPTTPPGQQEEKLQEKRPQKTVYCETQHVHGLKFWSQLLSFVYNWDSLYTVMAFEKNQQLTVIDKRFLYSVTHIHQFNPIYWQDEQSCSALMASTLWIISPINKQVLLHSEALSAPVTVEAVVVSPELRFGLVIFAFALWKLCQLILGGTERPRLLSDTWSVDHQTVL